MQYLYYFSCKILFLSFGRAILEALQLCNVIDF